MIICIISMCTILYMCIFHLYLGANCARAAGLPIWDFQIEEAGSQDFLIQNASGSTDSVSFHKRTMRASSSRLSISVLVF